jgi:heptosyltransferase-1
VQSFLIIKTSALGDVLQAFAVADYLRRQIPDAKIDWVVERSCQDLVNGNPSIDEVKVVDTKTWKKKICHLTTWQNVKKSISDLRIREYDAVFDLQGNIKSGLILHFIRAKDKVGFHKNSVAEKGNLLFTNVKIDVEPFLQIQNRYLRVVQKYLNDITPFDFQKQLLRLSDSEKLKFLSLSHSFPVKKQSIFLMVALGSNWENKKLSESTAIDLLKLLAKNHDVHFFLVGGNQKEKELNRRIASYFPAISHMIEDVSIPLLQHLMTQMDGVLSMDSCALHLAARAGVATFSVFGPSSPYVYKPIGRLHAFKQGSCPYGQPFVLRCPFLRKCATGACMKDLSAEELYFDLSRWITQLQGSEERQNQYELLQPQ